MNTESSDASIDLRFIEIEHQLFMLDQFFNAMERQLPVLAELERKRLDEQLPEVGEELAGMMRGSVDQFIEDELPRLLRSSVIVALWSICESAITEIANALRDEKHQTLRVRDIKGANTLDSASKYFNHVLAFPFITDAKERQDLEMLLLIRNAIAHANGREEAVRPESWNKIRSWEEAGRGVSTELGYLAFSTEFVEDMFTTVDSFLSGLVERVRGWK